MSHRVTVGAGQSNVQLPDGQAYGAGTAVLLTDDQFDQLAADIFTSGVLVDNGEVADTTSQAAPRTVNAATVVTAEDQLVEFNTAAAFNQPLPAGLPAGHRVAFRNLGTSTAAVTLVPASGTINGAANLALAAGTSADAEFDGANWVTV